MLEWFKITTENKKSVIAYAMAGFIGGILLTLFLSLRYELKASGGNYSFVYKIDRLTGQVYAVYPQYIKALEEKTD